MSGTFSKISKIFFQKSSRDFQLIQLSALRTTFENPPTGTVFIKNQQKIPGLEVSNSKIKKDTFLHADRIFSWKIKPKLSGARLPMTTDLTLECVLF